MGMIKTKMLDTFINIYAIISVLILAVLILGVTRGIDMINRRNK
jgi:hypothetical protein